MGAIIVKVVLFIPLRLYFPASCFLLKDRSLSDSLSSVKKHRKGQWYPHTSKTYTNPRSMVPNVIFMALNHVSTNILVTFLPTVARHLDQLQRWKVILAHSSRIYHCQYTLTCDMVTYIVNMAHGTPGNCLHWIGLCVCLLSTVLIANRWEEEPISCRCLST